MFRWRQFDSGVGNSSSPEASKGSEEPLVIRRARKRVNCGVQLSADNGQHRQSEPLNEDDESFRPVPSEPDPLELLQEDTTNTDIANELHSGLDDIREESKSCPALLPAKKASKYSSTSSRCLTTVDSGLKRKIRPRSRLESRTGLTGHDAMDVANTSALQSTTDEDSLPRSPRTHLDSSTNTALQGRSSIVQTVLLKPPVRNKVRLTRRDAEY